MVDFFLSVFGFFVFNLFNIFLLKIGVLGEWDLSIKVRDFYKFDGVFARGRWMGWWIVWSSVMFYRVVSILVC